MCLFRSTEKVKKADLLCGTFLLGARHVATLPSSYSAVTHSALHIYLKAKLQH